jgi:hypothetical protein
MQRLLLARCRFAQYGPVPLRARRKTCGSASMPERKKADLKRRVSTWPENAEPNVRAGFMLIPESGVQMLCMSHTYSAD